MTENEAIEVFKERLTFIKKHYAGEVKDYEEALEIGIEALEKQIPKKVVKGKVIARHCYSGVNKLISIDDVPTVYDVDKVVWQLRNLNKYNLNLADAMLDIQANGTNRHFICLEDAIEIVKAGDNA